MQVNLDMPAIEALRRDLVADGLDFIRLTADGELTVRDDRGKLELWIAREEGCGANNTYWAPEFYPGGFEFCSSAEARA